MREVHRIGDPNTAGAEVVSTLQSTVFANNILIAVDGSPVEGHGTGEHASPNTANGSQDVYINVIPVNRRNDPDTCGHPRDQGSPNVHVNDGSGSGIGGGGVGTVLVEGRVVYGNTPEAIALLIEEEKSLSPNLPSYHEDEPGGVTPATITTTTNSSGQVITVIAPPIQSPPANVQKDPERPPVPPDGCKNSKYYILADAKMAIKDQVGLTKEQIECNWIALCTNILDKLRDAGFTFKINSGFRTIEYNRSIGSSDSSDHTSGCAADISTGSQETNKTLFKALLNNYPYSQLIFEGNWVHVAYNGKSPKGGAKVMYTYTGSSPKSAGAIGEYLPGDLRTA